MTGIKALIALINISAGQPISGETIVAEALSPSRGIGAGSVGAAAAVVGLAFIDIKTVTNQLIVAFMALDHALATFTEIIGVRNSPTQGAPVTAIQGLSRTTAFSQKACALRVTGLTPIDTIRARTANRSVRSTKSSARRVRRTGRTRNQQRVKTNKRNKNTNSRHKSVHNNTIQKVMLRVGNTFAPQTQREEVKTK